MGTVFAPKSKSVAVKELYQKLYDMPYDERDDELIELYERVDAEFEEKEDELESQEDELKEEVLDRVEELSYKVKNYTKDKFAEKLQKLVSDYR